MPVSSSASMRPRLFGLLVAMVLGVQPVASHALSRGAKPMAGNIPTAVENVDFDHLATCFLVLDYIGELSLGAAEAYRPDRQALDRAMNKLVLNYDRTTPYAEKGDTYQRFRLISEQLDAERASDGIDAVIERRRSFCLERVVPAARIYAPHP